MQQGPYFRISRKFAGPSWLTTEGDSAPLGYALDVIKDAYAMRAYQGLLARLPQNDPTGQTTAPDDALAAMGRDRVIVRGINEASVAYAARMLRWLDDHQTRGNPFALMQQLRAYCGPNGTAGSYVSLRTVDVRGNWYSLDDEANQSVEINQANWDWDGDPAALSKWSRFWVIIYPNGLWTDTATWGDGSMWGEPGRTWGSSATPEEVQSVQSIVANWKPAGTRCVNIIVTFDPTSFNPATARDGSGLPDGTWGQPYKIVNGQYVPSRLSTARYWDGV